MPFAKCAKSYHKVNYYVHIKASKFPQLCKDLNEGFNFLRCTKLNSCKKFYC